MKFPVVRLLLLFFPASFLGCSSGGQAPLSIDFSADSASVVFKHVNPAGLLQLKNAGLPDSVWNDLISVLQTPSENDTAIVESPLPGKVLLKDSVIVFQPDSSFVKGRTYLVITHLNAEFGGLGKAAKSELSYTMKPLQKLLVR